MSVYNQQGKRGVSPTGLYLHDWMMAVLLKVLLRKEEPPPCPLTGRPVCLLLSEADLIVRVGDEGVRAQGSLGQPYFLTLVF